MRPLKRILFALLFVLQMPIYIIVLAYSVTFEFLGGTAIYWIITGKDWCDTKYGGNHGLLGKYSDLLDFLCSKTK